VVVGQLVRAADRYVVEDPRRNDARRAEAVHADRMAPSSSPPSQNPFRGANPDAVRVDLHDGTLTRVTSHPTTTSGGFFARRRLVPRP
jgi:hypothetical protein